MSDLAVQIVAPTGRDAALLVKALQSGNIAAENASTSIGSMTVEARDRCGPLLIAEEALEPSLIERLGTLLGTQPFWSDLPILVLTSNGRESQQALERQRQRLPLGHLTLLERPLRPATLASALEAAVRARQRQYQMRDATEKLDASIEALRASEEQNRLILQSTTDCIKLLDLNGNVLSINERGRQRLGIGNPGDVCGLSWITFWKGPESAEAKLAVDKALAGEEGCFEGFLETSDGESTWWDVCVTPVKQGDGAISALLCVSREITDRKLAQQALIQSEKLAAVGRLASSIAHEINNPLEAVTNLIFLAAQRTSEPEVREHLNAADQELRRVSVIANQTLRFHKQASLPQAVNAGELFATVLSIYEGRLKNSHVKVEIDFRAKHPVVCFEGDVRQVLNNLVGNAIDAMSAGGTLRLRSHEVHGGSQELRGIVLTVADSGSGMSPATMAKIFDAFFTTKGIGGTGLGLWVSQGIVARHKGTLRVRSKQGPGPSGSVFRFFLPYVG